MLEFGQLSHLVYIIEEYHIKDKRTFNLFASLVHNEETYKQHKSRKNAGLSTLSAGILIQIMSENQ
jgi:hypothetical protein